MDIERNVVIDTQTYFWGLGTGEETSGSSIGICHAVPEICQPWYTVWYHTNFFPHINYSKAYFGCSFLTTNVSFSNMVFPVGIPCCISKAFYSDHTWIFTWACVTLTIKLWVKQCMFYL